MKILDANDMKLSKYLLLDEGTLWLPYTQRPYTWNKPNVKRLFDDMMMLYENRNNEIQHMLNFFTFYSEEDKLFIFDGQQRTVTILIILSELINSLQNYNKTDSTDNQQYIDYCKDLRKKYIVKEPFFDEQPIQWKLRFDNDDANCALSHVLIGTEMKKEGISADYTETIISNHKYISRMINDYIDDNKLSREEIRLLIDVVLERTILIQLITSSEEIALSMFESLNNTGQQIELYYVLKNNCVSVLGDETKSFWDKIDANLNELDKSDFLVTVATLYNGKTQKAKSYDVLKQKNLLETKRDVETFLRNLEKLSVHYLHVKNPLLKKGDGDIIQKFRSTLNALSYFGFKQHVPLIIAMMANYDYKPEQVNEVLHLCLKIVVRNIFINKDRANTLEDFLADLSHKVFENDKNIFDEICNELKNKTAKDITVLKSLEDRVFDTQPDQKKLKYILREIMNHEGDKEVLVNEDLSKIWIEHILPQSPLDDSQWKKDFDDDIRYLYTYNLGNATLLLNKLNLDGSNSEFSVKKKSLLESAITHNRLIAENKEWTKGEIEKRCEELSKKILKIW